MFFVILIWHCKEFKKLTIHLLFLVKFLAFKLWPLVTFANFVICVNSLNQAGQYDLVAAKDGDPGGVRSEMDSVLSLDDGRWPRLAEESCSSLINEAREDAFQLVKQPSIPPVLAQLQQDFTPIPPSKVADPRPGPAKSSQDGMPSSDSYQHLHVVGFYC